MIKPTITWADFEKIDMRCGTIVRVEDNVKARKPAYVLQIDLGEEIGIKQSSAQITTHYSKEQLVGKQVQCVVNFEPKLVAGVKSEVLITGFYDAEGAVVLVTPTHSIDNGAVLG